jgi:hypothetical protein
LSSPTDPDASAAVIDLGSVTVQSIPAQEDRIDEIKEIRSQSQSEERLKRLEAIMYDRIDVKFSDAQVGLTSMRKWMNDANAMLT